MENILIELLKSMDDERYYKGSDVKEICNLLIDLMDNSNNSSTKIIEVLSNRLEALEPNNPDTNSKVEQIIEESNKNMDELNKKYGKEG